MINIKKGTAHSLQQSDKVVTAPASAMLAGQIVGVNTSNVAVVPDATYKTVGFLMGNSTDGDVLESGKIAVLLLDGNSVVETDQVTGSAPSKIGELVYADIDGGSGKVISTAGTANKAIGYFEGSRTLPSAWPWPSSGSPLVTQTWVDRAGTTNTASNVKPGWASTTVWGIKLLSGQAA